MYTTWGQTHVWPDWALDIRYNRTHGTNEQTQDGMARFQNQSHMLERYVIDRIRTLSIENLDEDVKRTIMLLFVDVDLREQKLASGNGYFIYNRRTNNLVMSVIIANRGCST